MIELSRVRRIAFHIGEHCVVLASSLYIYHSLEAWNMFI